MKKYKIRVFTKDFLMDELGLPYDECSDDVKIIEREIEDQSRWETQSSLIFEYKGITYQTYFSRGSTEQQDFGPWDDEDEIECMVVEPYEKTITDYRPVEDG